jgi:hypothetical protein
VARIEFCPGARNERRNDSRHLGTVIVYVTVAKGPVTTTQCFHVTLIDASPPTLAISANNGTGAGCSVTTLPNGTER